MAAHVLTCRPAPVREAPKSGLGGSALAPHTLRLGNQNNKTHQGNKGEKESPSAYSSSQTRTSSLGPGGPAVLPSSLSRCRDKFGAVPPVLGGESMVLVEKR